MNIHAYKVTAPSDLAKCFDIRLRVFVHGQNVPLEREQDGLDETSEHYLLTVGQVPTGTARVRYVQDKAKIERVAILDGHQGKGLGKQLMELILADLRQSKKVHKAVLSAQSYSIPFYERLGFVVCSEEYLDAGIAHKDMILQFY